MRLQATPRTPASSTLLIAVITTIALASARCATPSAPSSPVGNERVDVLDFLIGDAALWPRRGTQFQNQIVDRGRQEVCWTKYGNARMFECWRWTDQWIIHAVDHALDGYSRQSYSFTDGRWLPRFITTTAGMPADSWPWTLDVADNRIRWFDAGCTVDLSRSHVFPYRLRAGVFRQMSEGFWLGTRDTLILEYEPYDPAIPTQSGHTERYYFGRGAGWYLWSAARAQVFFDQPGGPATPMDRSVWCTSANPPELPPHDSGPRN